MILTLFQLIAAEELSAKLNFEEHKLQTGIQMSAHRSDSREKGKKMQNRYRKRPTTCQSEHVGSRSDDPENSLEAVQGSNG